MITVVGKKILAQHPLYRLFRDFLLHPAAENQHKKQLRGPIKANQGTLKWDLFVKILFLWSQISFLQ